VGVVAVALTPDTGQHTAAAPTARATHATVSPAAKAKAGPPTSAHVTKAQYGARWPFVHVKAGTVRCVLSPAGIGEVTFTADGGPTWALNGTALDHGVPDIPKREWRKDPAIPGARIDVAPLREPVARACGL